MCGMHFDTIRHFSTSCSSVLLGTDRLLRPGGGGGGGGGWFSKKSRV